MNVNWLLAIFVSLLACDLVLRVYYVRVVLGVFETKLKFRVSPSSPVPYAEEIEFPTVGGLTLRGSLYRQKDHPAKGLILFCPETDCNHWSAASYCEGLIQNGFDVMSFDFRGQGESDPLPGYVPNHWPTNYEADDVRAALKYISSRDDLRTLPLGLMGVSRGSTLALIAAAESPDVKAVCCEGAYSIDALMLYFMKHWATIYMPVWLQRLVPLWHYRITLVMVRWVSRILRRRPYVVLESWLPKLKNRPVLLVSGGSDNYVHPQVAYELIARISSPAAQVWQVPHAKHNRARTVAQQEYDRRLSEFFSQMIPPATAA